MDDISKLKIGLFAIGLQSYWSQYQHLKQRLNGYLHEVETKINSFHPDVINAGLIDNVDAAYSARALFRKEDVDLVIIYVTTYALSSTALVAVQRLNVPVLVLNLSPAAAIDYNYFNSLQSRTEMTGEWLAFCSACAVPELANVFLRVGIHFHEVTGMVHDDPVCWKEIQEWVEAAKVARIMRYNRLGCMGHYYGGMLDIYSDLTQHYAQFGGHIELIEVEELVELRKQVAAGETDARVNQFYNDFDIQPDCSGEDLKKGGNNFGCA